MSQAIVLDEPVGPAPDYQLCALLIVRDGQNLARLSDVLAQLKRTCDVLVAVNLLPDSEIDAQSMLQLAGQGDATWFRYMVRQSDPAKHKEALDAGLLLARSLKVSWIYRVGAADVLTPDGETSLREITLAVATASLRGIRAADGHVRLWRCWMQALHFDGHADCPLEIERAPSELRTLDRRLQYDDARVQVVR
jgi:hypothetical protein